MAETMKETPEQVMEWAKTRIQQAINKNGNYSHNICSVVLMAVHQKVGRASAKDLINEFSLDDLYGIQIHDEPEREGA